MGACALCVCVCVCVHAFVGAAVEIHSYILPAAASAASGTCHTGSVQGGAI
jgi:hypothetical protein